MLNYQTIFNTSGSSTIQYPPFPPIPLSNNTANSLAMAIAVPIGALIFLIILTIAVLQIYSQL